MGIVRPWPVLLGTAFERIFEMRYGTSGMLFLFLLGVGVRTRNPTCLTIAAVLLALLLAER
ncbi:hypothetical protein C9J60_19670 [Streptomyces sp. A244]|uniref:hypothetical protein n=1 Tax=Streptomyces TaxID=1883 RepID=UPI000D1BEFED|nr:hypothetical protein [Streptomyces sp. A244]PTH86461.1 hypothetical protein C9J60_19670 [Streptomyces sp. A244]